MKLALFVSVLYLLSVGVESSPQTTKWQPISVLAKRAILAASTAAEFLEVDYISLLKAWVNVEVQHPNDEYRVIFKARCQYGILKRCQADVLLQGFTGKVSNASCWEPTEEAKAQYFG
ncbi:uncharacterized protein LOC132746888 isoform X3 [Ruditapes philippinarum]|uniref:uncharacterized protein LOC132746888 isoform X2 n=1 Tax=Ruditapes philippinarum TaxID=129788 RepID=UPI00295AF8FB|nr:uncharacterized protein LOC132746888 isoform X2 [Ruditapes philippinarum]XP_060592151.1 uncharacterized protein LOC132746888 isoform X3 [Ruditapes philippinarum]